MADDLSIGRVFYLLLLFSAFFSKSVLKVPQGGYLKILFVFSLWAFLTSYWSFKPDETMYRCLYLVQYFVLAVILQNVTDTPQKFHWLCGAWFLGAMYIATETIFNYLVYGITSASLYRVDEFGNANENSFMLCFGVILFLVNAERIKYKILIYAVLLYSFLAILANGSRTGFIMYLLVILSISCRNSSVEASPYIIFFLFFCGWLSITSTMSCRRGVMNGSCIFQMISRAVIWPTGSGFGEWPWKSCRKRCIPPVGDWLVYFSLCPSVSYLRVL